MPTPPPDGLEIATALLCQELWGGGFFVAPVADASLACRGDTLAACLSEQRLFLEEMLVDAAPEVLARFSSPKKTELLEIEVEAPRPDLPKRLAIPGKIALACVLVPFAEESWAFLPALGHAVRVERKADVVEVVTADAERLISALELAPGEYLQLLPPRKQTLEWLTLKLRRSDLEVPHERRQRRRDRRCW